MYPYYIKFPQTNPYSNEDYHPQIIGVDDVLPTIRLEKIPEDIANRPIKEIIAVMDRNRLYSEEWESNNRFNSPTPIDIKTELLIYPKIAAAVVHQHFESAFRCWVICRSIDNKGRGSIRLSEYREFITTHSVKYQTSQNWLNKASQYGWIKIVDKIIYITSIQAISNLLGLKKTGIDWRDYGRPEVIKIEDFVKRSWHYLITGAAREQNSKNLISQKTFQNLGYFCPRTQQNHSKQLKPEKERNFYNTHKKENELPQLLNRENRGKYFVLIKGVIYARIPDKWFIPNDIARKHVVIANDEQSKILLENDCYYSINHPRYFYNNKNHPHYFPNWQEKTLDINRIRLFHESYESAKSLAVGINESNIPEDKKPKQLFYPSGHYGNIKLWDYVKVRN